MNIGNMAIHLGAVGFVSGAFGYAFHHGMKDLRRVVNAAEWAALETQKARGMHEQACAVFSRVADAMGPVARRAEIELERMDRARPVIDPGNVDLGMHPVDLTDNGRRIAPNLNAIFGKMGVALPSLQTDEDGNLIGGVNGDGELSPVSPRLPVDAPDPSKPLDVPCPACSGKEWPHSRCRLCFGSYMTSATAAADYVAARELPGAF